MSELVAVVAFGGVSFLIRWILAAVAVALRMWAICALWTRL